MKKRIAIFIPQLAAGGVQRCVILLAKGFLNNGLDVDLVVGRADGPFRRQVPAEVNLVDLHSAHIRSALPGLLRYLKASTPTALLSAQTHANIVAAWACKLSKQKIRLVVSEHNNMTAVVNSPGAGKDRLRPILARLFYPWADEIVAVSQGVARSLTDLTGISSSHIQVIYNPLIPEDLDGLRTAPCSHPWLPSNKIPVILAVGRLEKQKDYPTLIQAAAIINKRQEIHLLILGEGSERPFLEALVTQSDIQAIVDMPGYVDNVYAYMNRSSVFVLSSAWEGFPSVLVEAMACEIPVVSTDCPSGPDEILEGGRYGRLVPAGNPDAMAEAIEAALKNPGALEQARTRAGEFSIERAVQKYLPLLIGSAA
jgi:glycosyltransferase involved in cell wall biosynthesis